MSHPARKNGNNNKRAVTPICKYKETCTVCATVQICFLSAVILDTALWFGHLKSSILLTDIFVTSLCPLQSQSFAILHDSIFLLSQFKLHISWTVQKCALGAPSSPKRGRSTPKEIQAQLGLQKLVSSNAGFVAVATQS